MRASTASHHAPSHLHAAWAFRMPLGLFACRFGFRMPLAFACRSARARTTTPTTHKCSHASHHHSRILPASSPSCCAAIIPMLTAALNLTAPSQTAHAAASSDAAASCRPLLSIGINKLAAASLLNSTYAAHHHHHHHHPHRHCHSPCRPFGTALHRCCCLPPADHTATVLCKHHATAAVLTRLLTALHRQLTPPLLLAVTLHGTWALVALP